MATGILYNHVNAQSKGGIEQYNYFNNSGMSTIMPVVHIENKTGWHSEIRYNYEELKTFSLYAGKSFSHNGFMSWSITPMVGVLIGNLKGGSAAINIDMEYRKLFLSSLPEFVVTMDGVNRDFFYNWSELGYNIGKWIYAGISLQQTITGTDKETQTGVMTGFRIKKFTFPVYFFNLLKQTQYFILGINWEWNKTINQNF
jgi:hypothetical protein